LWFCSNSKIYCVNNGKIINIINLPLPSGYYASNILADKFGRIWLAFLNKGFYLFDNNKLINIGKKTGIERYPVSSIKEDNEGNVWVTTLGTGVFCFHHMYVFTFTETDGLSSNSIKEINIDSKDRILAGTLDGLNIIDNDTIINFKTGFENDLYTYIFEIKPFGNYVYLGGGFKDSFFFKSLNNNGVNIISRVVSSIEVKDKYLITGGWGNYIKVYDRLENYQTVKKIFLEGDTLKNIRVNKILLDKNGSIWVGTSNGVFLLDSSFNSTRFDRKELNSLSVSDIGQDRKGNLWFICNNGVYLYHVKKDSIMEFTNFKGNDFIAASSVAIDLKNRVWIGSSNGINRIEYDNDNISVKNFDRDIGLPSNEVSSLFCDTVHNNLWAGTTAGISKIDLDEFDKESLLSHSILIETILVNDTAVNPSHSFSLDQNSHANIAFSALNYSNSEAVEYEYRFDGTPGDWEKTKEPRLYFSSLESGDYKLLIRGNFGNGSITAPAVVEFNVKPNFYQTLFFYIVAVLTGALLVSLVIYRRVKIHYKREGERAGYRAVISELKQQSLASMMNPHFIFNSLNSIQSFINKYEKDSANEYLAKFARLIRLNLNEADKTFILLIDEIERLKLYLELEKLRFGERLDYEIFIAPDIDPSKTLIPNMIIQPFVENSIIHGIIPTGQNGLININIFHAPMPKKLKENFVAIYNQSLHKSAGNIEDNPDYCIKIVVEDNGIGINEAQKQKYSKHVSRGLQIIRERISILHHYSGKDELVTISDKQALGEKTSGTRVEIILSPNIYSVQSD
ncbi:MAG: hypothetical protein EHM58_08275, partial [Ignavibacteriae bacterium]